MFFRVFLLVLILAEFDLSDGLLSRARRGVYMSPYSRPNYDDQWYQNSHNSYQNWGNQYQNQYQNNGYGYGSGYGRPYSPYGAQQQTYSYGRPTPSYSPYSRPKSSYGRPPQIGGTVVPPVVAPVPAEPTVPVVPPVAPPVPVVPPVAPPVPVPTPVVPPVAPPVPVPTPVVPPVVPTGPVAPTAPLFGGIEPGAGSLAPGEAPPLPPTDEEMTRVDPAEKENEARKARGGPPGFNVDSIVETGTLPPQASVPEIPMPPSA